MSSRQDCVFACFCVRVEVDKLKSNTTNKSYQSYLALQDGKTMLFRKPPVVRRMETLLTVGVFVQLVVGPLVGAVLTGKPLWAVVVLVGLSWVFWFLYRVVGPNDIRLDGERLTYEQTIGWPWKPTTRAGPFSDIMGVCLSPNNNVVLLIAKPGRATMRVIISNPSLASVGSSAFVVDKSYVAESRALAEELNRVYGFPAVPCPKR